MKTSDFYFDLPKELIAQDPLEDRSSSRLLVLDRKTGAREHRIFRDIVEYLNPATAWSSTTPRLFPPACTGPKRVPRPRSRFFC